MKPIIKVILIIIVIVMIMPTIIAKLFPKDDDRTTEAPLPEDIDEIIIVPEREDIYISMYNHQTKEIEKMYLEDYIVGVVAGEMPATFDIEALKAQAVAARTLAVYKMRSFGGSGCNQKEGADVCSSFAHCQEWLSTDRMKKNWEDEFQSKYDKIKKAVSDTWGEVIKYEGKPIEVLYHSTSNGKTEDAGEVFSQSRPYYKVVESEGEENAPKFSASVTFTNQKFVDIFKKNYKSNLTAKNLSNQIKINGYTDSGRVSSISVAGIKLKATAFRLMYGLNSTDFTLQFTTDSVTINTKGFGHGVGMSQVGADQMAKRGYSYKDILKHYYQNVEVEGY